MDVILISSSLYGKSSIKINNKLLIYKKLCVFSTPENSIYYSINEYIRKYGTYKHKKRSSIKIYRAPLKWIIKIIQQL